MDALLAQYREAYEIGASHAQLGNLREQARVEAGMRAFLREGGFSAFTTTFEDLHGLAQLPGLAVQRLMADGYGFGGEESAGASFLRLDGSVWTTDNDKAMKIASRIRTGTYAVNMYAFDPGAPFGGYKNSGIGRENGPEGIDAYVELKSVLLPFGYTPDL
jgi:hypothetical protein